ncbi:MAG TPA: response regulator transcription factor [Alphaproteobacteria bacterium]|nr:response regulator transcription factor [Alphaproteobacteria bacterium]
MPHQVIIADDHPLVRGALRQAVAQALADAAVVEASSLDEVVEILTAQGEDAVDLLLLDLHMPGMQGFTGLFTVRAQFPAVPVVVVSASEEPSTMRRAVDYGAAGFVPKSAALPQIAHAIGQVLAGNVWLPEGAAHAAPDDSADFARRLAALTPQQLRVLAMLTEGKLNKQIAYELSVSEATIKAHVTAILRKLGVNSRTQAVIAAGKLAIEPPVPALDAR